MKAKSFAINSQLLGDMFKRGVHHSYEITENPLPEDGRVTAVFAPFDQEVVLLRIESESFPEVKPWCVVPQMEPATIQTRITEDKLDRMITQWIKFWEDSEDMKGFNHEAAMELCALAGVEY
jgi:hypothetical protein